MFDLFTSVSRCVSKSQELTEPEPQNISPGGDELSFSRATLTAAGTTDVKFSMVLILQQISAAATCGTKPKLIDINLRYSVFLWRTSVLLSVSSHLQMSKETRRSVRSCDGAVNTSACY